jgi:hypothetical protein
MIVPLHRDADSKSLSQSPTRQNRDCFVATLLATTRLGHVRIKTDDVTVFFHRIIADEASAALSVFADDPNAGF